MLLVLMRTILRYNKLVSCFNGKKILKYIPNYFSLSSYVWEIQFQVTFFLLQYKYCNIVENTLHLT